MPVFARHSLLHRLPALAAGLLVLVLGTAAAARGQDVRLDSALAGAGLDARLGQTIPQDLVFFDEAGRAVSLGSYFDGRTPVLLTMVYHNCPMLCSMVLDGLTKSLKELAWVPGEEYEVVTVSFAADETPELAARQKERYLKLLGKPGAEAGWHFLTGDEAAIQALAEAIGFQYNWVEAQQTYAHPAVLTFASGDGMITRYLQGLEFPPRHVRNALVEASEGQIGSPLDQALLFCFRFDPSVNSYVLHAANLMKVGGALTLLALGVMLLFFFRREQRENVEILNPNI